MSTIVTRSGKGSPLTHNEVDANFNNLNTDKYQSGSNASFGTLGATGVATFSAGTVSAPAITTTGDTNTGIFFPAADTIAFTEGGVESMRIDSAGNLGIGTSSPNVKLQINGASGNSALRFNETTSNRNTYIGFIDTSGNFGIDVNDGGYLRFAVTAAERMRIDSVGQLHLGNTTPTDGHTSSSQFFFGLTGNLFSQRTSGLGILGTSLLENQYIKQSTGDFAYTTTAPASRITLQENVIRFINSPSGTAGAAISETERMRIGSNGNIVIGSTDTINSGGKLVVVPTNTTGSSVYQALDCTNYVDSNFQVNITGSASTDKRAVVGSTTSTSLAFQTASTERMRIDSSGNLLVGATSTVSSAQLYVTGSVADRFIRFTNSQPSAPFGVIVSYSAASPNDTGKSFLFCSDSTATRADIRSNGGLANYSANNVNLSDAREKTNVELAGSYLDKICSIPVKTFNYIDQNREDDDGLTLGVIAQDVQAIAPELVTESDWGTENNPKMRLSIYQTDLQYALMKAIQELKAELDSVKAELQTLKGN